MAAGGEAQPLKGKLDQNGKRSGVLVRHGDAQGACNARNQRLPAGSSVHAPGIAAVARHCMGGAATRACSAELTHRRAERGEVDLLRRHNRDALLPEAREA